MIPPAAGAALVGGLLAGPFAASVVVRFGPHEPCGAVPRSASRSIPRRRRVPVVESTMAFAWLAVVYRFGVGWAAVPPLVAATSLVVLSAIDLRTYRLPDAVTFPAAATSLVAVVGASLALQRPGAIVSALAVGVGYGGVMWGAHELQPSGLGFGDVKLAPLLGIHVGWVAGALHPGWSPVVGLAAQALLLSSVIGLAMGLGVALLRRLGYRALEDPGARTARAASARLLDTGFPFGPPLAAGTMAAVLFSPLLVG